MRLRPGGILDPQVGAVRARPREHRDAVALACAYVVLTSGASATEEELIAFAGESLAAYKRPRLIRFVDTLPTTSTGKIMRRELIQMVVP